MEQFLDTASHGLNSLPTGNGYCCVNLQEMCSLQCSLHEVNKGEQTRVVVDSQVTQHGGSREFLIVQ